MNKVTFSWIIRVIHDCSGSEKESGEYLLYILDNMLPNPTDNPYKGVSMDYLDRIYNGSRNISKTNAQKICSLFESSKLCSFFNSLGDDCLYRIETLIKEKIPSFELDDTSGYNLSDLILNEIKTIANTPRKNGKRKKSKTKAPSEANSTSNESDILTAREFLILHENEISLIPLCQIALRFDPEHNHIRRMYTDFCLLPDSVRRIILKQSDSSFMMDIDTLHWQEGLTLLCDDLRKYKLSSERYIYMLAKYFPRFRHYSDINVKNYDIHSFERKGICKATSCFSRITECSLNIYIDDYLWMKENKTKYRIAKPMDYLIISKHLDISPEEDVVFWICRFIIDTCNNLCHRIVGQPICANCFDDAAETIEDISLSALLALHRHYGVHNKDYSSVVVLDELSDND